MYAVVKIKGVQYKVKKDDHILAPYDRTKNIGDKLETSEVLIVGNGDKIEVGKPYVEGAKVEAEVVDFKKGEKIISFKKKRRKGYHRKKGFRAKYMELRILDIVRTT